MASEARRGLARIATNYARLFVTVAIGLVLVPIWLAWIGNDGFAILVLVAASAGLASTLQDVMRHSMVRELGSAWHDDDPDRFPRIYASSFVICVIVAALTALVFAVLVLVIPLLNVPPELVAPARWILFAEGVWTCLLVLLSPVFNMYVVSERFAAHNTWTAALRVAQLVATLLIYLGLGIREPALGLTLYGFTTAGLSILVLLAAVLLIALPEPRLLPKPRLIERTAIREVAGTFGWNSAVAVAMSLHERIGALIMNLVFGLWGNAIFGLALRLVSYVRMGTLGMTFGLDAVSARLTSAEDHDVLRSVVRHSTRLHGFVALPAGLGVMLLTEPLLRLWVGRVVQDPDAATGLPVLASATVLVRIMVVGMACRAIADGWMKLLYGAGHVRRYAPLVLLGGVANPVLATVLIMVLPDEVAYTGVAWAFAAAFVVVHFGMLPFVAARVLGISWVAVVTPLLRPALLTAIPAPVLVASVSNGGGATMGWTQLIVTIGLYGMIYAALGFFFGLSARERQRIRSMATRMRQSDQRSAVSDQQEELDAETGQS